MKHVAPLLFMGFTVIGCAGDLLAPRHMSLGEAMTDARTPAPTLTAVASTSTQISLSWTDNSPNETGWEIWRSSTGGSGTFTLIASVDPNSTNLLDSGVTPKTEYCYQVRSFRKTGAKVTYDVFIGVSCVTTPPAPPAASNLDAAFGENPWVLVRWTPPSTTPNATRLQRALGRLGPWTTVADLDATATSYTDADVAIEHLYCYRVSAVYSGDESLSNVDCTARPAAPTNLIALPAPDAQSVDLHWADNSTVETQYEIQRSLDGVTPQTIATASVNATTYHDAGLASNTRYWYRLRARSDDALSAYSPWTTVLLISDPPNAPTGVRAFPQSSTAITVAWSPSLTATSFRIERSADGQTTWQVVGSTTQSFVADGQRTPEQEVCYRVFAANSKGESAASQVTCTRPPLPPADVRITSQDDGTLLVSWTDKSNVEDAYLVMVLVMVIECDPSGCFYQCDNNGCYLATCSLDGCFPVQQRQAFVLPANATSLPIGSSDTFEAVYAMRDGGTSDPGALGTGPTVTSNAWRGAAPPIQRPDPTQRLQPPSKRPCRTRRC